MKGEALLLLAIASFVMLALPAKASAYGLNEAQEQQDVKRVANSIE